MAVMINTLSGKTQKFLKEVNTYFGFDLFIYTALFYLFTTD